MITLRKAVWLSILLLGISTIAILFVLPIEAQEEEPRGACVIEGVCVDDQTEEDCRHDGRRDPDRTFHRDQTCEDIASE